jgi:hypothetical protein
MICCERKLDRGRHKDHRPFLLGQNDPDRKRDGTSVTRALII